MKKPNGFCRTAIIAGLLGTLVFALPGCRAKARDTVRFDPVSGRGSSAARIPVAAQAGPYRNPAVVQDGEQTISTTFSSRRYVPITVQAGVPVKWTISVEPGNLNGCNGAMVIPKFGIRKRLQVGDTVVEFTPTETGNIDYSCWMGMIRSTITVVKDLSAVSAPAELGTSL
jgi:hypothetical protein